jgi:hypothetical protein
MQCRARCSPDPSRAPRFEVGPDLVQLRADTDHIIPLPRVAGNHTDAVRTRADGIFKAVYGPDHRQPQPAKRILASDVGD